jgi:hypothetical protein
MEETPDLFDNLLPKDPKKRDMTILALIVIPLMVAGVIWGILGDFDTSESVATPVPSPSVTVESTPPASGATTPAAFIIADAA